MADSTQRRPSVPDHASRLAGLIAERGLLPGDPFLTTGQAAQFLRVRRDVANRALQVLVQQGRIERRQRVGATVAAPPSAAPVIERVHFLVQEDHLLDGTGYSDAAQVGVHSELPGCEVDLTLVPTGGAKSFLDPILRRALRRPGPEGVVLVRCDYPTQRLVAQSGLPAVVHGSPYAGIELPSVDVDSRQMGLLQGEALHRRGCEKLVVLRPDRSLPGDRMFMTGIREAATRFGIASDRLEEVGLVPFPELVRAELERLFRTEELLGIVCVTREIADAAWTAAMDAGRVPGADFWLHSNTLGSGTANPPFPCLVAQQDAQAQGAILGRLLADRLADPNRAVEHRLVACDFQLGEGRS